MGLDRGQRRFFLFLVVTGLIILFFNLSMLSGTDMRSNLKKIPIPGLKNKPDSDSSKSSPSHQDQEVVGDTADQHPIAALMKEADEAFRVYDESRSKTFQETVAKYRRKYGRHPPPKFREWYKFARDRNVYNIDDFEQVMDDLRPFWGVDPAIIRSQAAHLHAIEHDGISGIHIRSGKVWMLSNENWRAETMEEMIKPYVKHLPDMDIAMNRLDQPRVAVPWDDMQALLANETASRLMLPEAVAEFTTNMSGLWQNGASLFEDGKTEPLLKDPEWFRAPGQQYMLIAKEACPPESHARDPELQQSTAEATYKSAEGGFITNFNLSSDLCTIGPEVQDKHGFLYASSTVVASKLPLPVFGECKVNINNDILFPANKYYDLEDVRYTYDPKGDVSWDDKVDNMVWRGVSSGGTNTAETWKNMHRQRLALLTNGTVMQDTNVNIMAMDPDNAGAYKPYDQFQPGEFATKYTDVGFTEPYSCVPDCGFYDNVWTYKSAVELTDQFKRKFLIDVDGHSFSGRWHAFLQSKSLGIKSTIFREWHDSRLFAWRHFVPLDNRYDELYSILTYFIGLGDADSKGKDGKPYVQRHDFEGRKLGRQGREWAKKVLRKEDIEIYTFRLLIEYARIIDDNRDRIGYSGDGSELDKYDSQNPISGQHGWGYSAKNICIMRGSGGAGIVLTALLYLRRHELDLPGSSLSVATAKLKYNILNPEILSSAAYQYTQTGPDLRSRLLSPARNDLPKGYTFAGLPKMIVDHGDTEVFAYGIRRFLEAVKNYGVQLEVIKAQGKLDCYSFDAEDGIASGIYGKLASCMDADQDT
ncbi:glycosyltransferase family 90 protein [Sclerotinia borealis F-4128]|uniref:Glycosyltransferase family 90 protein n=1 Tax=Sclerotinia borealis (strain F-4128) TaxID=1432307 RepID=W9CL90_SCLBF|nr:glycosyltransferase family 90 protein [Sclerotinia borealis F-4128]